MVSGSAYIEHGFSFYPSDLWRNWGIIVSLITFFLIMVSTAIFLHLIPAATDLANRSSGCQNVVLGEFLQFGMGGNAARVYRKPDAERTELNRRLLEKRDEHRKAKKDMESSDLKLNSKSVLTWEALNYHVPVPGGSRRLLNNVYGYVKPGQLTALMGASGAGKTTLLDVLAARKNIGVIAGDVLVDGIKPGKQFQACIPPLYLC